jgi:asparagine synthase (glutamine-hydrolysing)
MSGFVAIINTNGAPVDRNILKRLTDSLAYRGPDRQHSWVDAHVGFGHTLFQTTDEAEYEFQPSSLEGDVWITGSLRIDARNELINALGLQSEIKLECTPDSDLVLHAYRAWGNKCLHYLRGDFAFVLWDKQKQKLLCARDHFGMQQLYYAKIKHCLVSIHR